MAAPALLRGHRQGIFEFLIARFTRRRLTLSGQKREIVSIVINNIPSARAR